MIFKYFFKSVVEHYNFEHKNMPQFEYNMIFAIKYKILLHKCKN